ncbi:MAG: hypothetical protein KGK18_19115 [Burkholderiales bacterium]|nr:hypothetical protein [Burkholderiales bacterium]
MWTDEQRLCALREAPKLFQLVAEDEALAENIRRSAHSIKKKYPSRRKIDAFLCDGNGPAVFATGAVLARARRAIEFVAFQLEVSEQVKMLARRIELAFPAVYFIRGPSRATVELVHEVGATERE